MQTPHTEWYQSLCLKHLTLVVHQQISQLAPPTPPSHPFHWQDNHNTSLAPSSNASLSQLVPPPVPHSLQILPPSQPTTPPPSRSTPAHPTDSLPYFPPYPLNSNTYTCLPQPALCIPISEQQSNANSEISACDSGRQGSNILRGVVVRYTIVDDGMEMGMGAGWQRVVFTMMMVVGWEYVE